MPIRACLLAAAAVLLLQAAGCRRTPAFNVLLLTLDTTCRDHLGCYGDSTARTPTLDSLAADGVRFERCWSVAPVTLTAHASIMTGLYPPTHGVRDNGLYRLGDSLPTLAEALGRAGYSPAAVVAAYVLASRFGLARGFTRYDERFGAPSGRAAGFIVERNAEAVSDAALEYLESLGKDEPFALWLHYYDPHAPYVPPAPFDSLFREAPYDGEVAFMDSRIGRVIGWLKRTGRYDNTLILAVADHGEALGSHGEPTHGIFLYNPTLRVPLIVKLPHGEAAGRVVEADVSQVDILPTLLDYLGQPLPPGLPGRSLLPQARGTEAATQRTFYFETCLTENSFGWSPLYGCVHGSEKYILAPEPELYDLAADPEEVHNVAAVDSAALRAAAVRFTRLERDIQPQGAPPSNGLALDAENAQRLRALGYIAGSLPGVSRDRAARPDPKTMLRNLGSFLAGVMQEAEGDYSAALESFGRALEHDPGNAFAHLYRGFIFWRQERFPDAQAELRAAVEANPQCEGNYLLGLLDLRLDSLESAGRFLARALEANPSHARAAFLLAEVQLRLGRPDSALALLRTARSLAPQDKEILNDLGKLLLDNGDPSGAAGCFEAALEVDSLYPLALFNLGIAAWCLDDLPRAEACLERVAARFSRDEKVQNNLGVVLFSAGKTARAEAAYRAALAA
ncbi:sulfatase-like hydrolase/transferase, partial [bacterium]|nr:sulfatase-like hydrolase/transferase [bacterium]